MRSIRVIWLSACLTVVAACHASRPPVTTGSAEPVTAPDAAGVEVVPPAEPEVKNLDSTEILARPVSVAMVHVKHVLIGWSDLAEAYGGQLDPRAAARSQAQAATLAQEVLATLRANPDAIEAQIKAHSEDPGSLTGEPYVVEPSSPMVPEFVDLALRLAERESGIVKTRYGYHVMLRILPPPPDPLESAAILARPAQAGPIQVQHILIGWDTVPAARDPQAKARTKAAADTLATELLAKLRNRGNMAKLMKEHSEDPGSAETGRAYEVTPEAGLVEGFKNLGLRLKLGEVGLVRTQFGWHVMKRVPPPPPDALESASILKRAPTTEKAKVKHILLGWKDVHADDKRGVMRTRAELEKLVKATLAKLRAGTKIEPLMKELSEDPGSAETGEGYDVLPESPLVPPFKNLALRLRLNEIGVVVTEFGLHIIQRVE